jgi:hypothetical protein
LLFPPKINPVLVSNLREILNPLYSIFQSSWLPYFS